MTLLRSRSNDLMYFIEDEHCMCRIVSYFVDGIMLICYLYNVIIFIVKVHSKINV